MSDEVKKEEQKKGVQSGADNGVSEKSDTNKELENKYSDLLDKVAKMTAIELSELVKAIESRFGISAAMPIMAAGGVAAEGGAEEKSEFNVVLKDVGGQKIQVIKIIKEITGLGLQESKAIVDGVPKTIKENVKKEEAEEMKKKLEEAGAVVELK